MILLLVLPILLLLLSGVGVLISLPWWGIVPVCVVILKVESRLLANRPAHIALATHRIVACIYLLTILTCFFGGLRESQQFILAAPFLVWVYGELVKGSTRTQRFNPIPSRFNWQAHLPLIYLGAVAIATHLVVSSEGIAPTIITSAGIMLAQFLVLGLANRIESPEGHDRLKLEQVVIGLVVAGTVAFSVAGMQLIYGGETGSEYLIVAILGVWSISLLVSRPLRFS